LAAATLRRNEPPRKYRRSGGQSNHSGAWPYHLFDWLVTGQVVPANAAASVRGPQHIVKGAKTPMLDRAEARASQH
jgi:hypothetical protein